MNKQRQALIKVLAVGYYGPNSPLHKIIYEALAEPEQEPVADADLYAVWLAGFHARKPLTPEQRLEIVRNAKSPADIIDAIERAHGIGENNE